MQLDIRKFGLQRRPFALGFLNAILTENPLTGREYRANGLDIERLGDRDQRGEWCGRDSRLPCGLDAREDIPQSADGSGLAWIALRGHHMAQGLARARLARAATWLNRRYNSPLPALVFLTDDDRTPDPLKAVRALPQGSLVILRARRTSRRIALVDAVAPVAKERRLFWLVADDPELASRAGADGAHFPEARMAAVHHWRAVRAHWLITCAAHSLGACLHIGQIGADAAVLAPTFSTRSHGDGRALGPIRVRAIARQSAVPVYALGGIDDQTARRLRDADLAGLAAVGALAS